MVRLRYIFSILLIFLVVSIAVADRLPNGSQSSNFQLPTTSNVQVIGMMDAHTKVQIDSSNFGFNNTGFLHQGDAISSLLYTNDMITNGGYLSEAKHQTFDEGAQVGGYNVDSKIVSTYASDSSSGSKMSSKEKILMSTAGNWSLTDETIKNVLVASIIDEYIGGFNSNYEAGSNLEMTTGQIATIAKARSVGKTDTVPAATVYTLGIHPDMSTGLPYAEGSAATRFALSNEEGYMNTTNFSSTKELTDETKVSGMIFQFGKAFEARSGIEL